MSVPYEEIGPGQKGRLVYQLMGDGGPFPNPKNIRYLPPDKAPTSMPDSAPVGLPALGGALATTGILLNAGVQMHNAMKLRQVESHLARVLPRLSKIERKIESIESKLDVILQKLDTIQKMQAQDELRNTLQFLLEKKHVRDQEINLKGLAEDVLEAIDRFEEMADIRVQLGGAKELQFTVETRDYLQNVFQLLLMVRRLAYQKYNKEQRGDPTSALRSDLQEDYWPSDVAPFNVMRLTIQGMHWGTQKKAVKKYIGDHMSRIFENADPVAYRLRPLFYDMDENLEPEVYDAFKKWWLWESSAGLLHRVRQEAKGITEGYEQSFGLDVQPLADSDENGALEERSLSHLVMPAEEEELEEITKRITSYS